MLSQILEAVSLMPFMAPSQAELIQFIPASTASDTAWIACSIYCDTVSQFLHREIQAAIIAAMMIMMGLAMAAAPTARMMVIIMRPAVRKVLPMPLATMAMPRQTG
jgi:hypothetical protein